MGDLGYPADQRLVATAILGLQLLADEIDEVRGRLNGAVQPEVVGGPADISAQLDELTDQLRKLTKVVKRVSKNQ